MSRVGTTPDRQIAEATGRPEVLTTAHTGVAATGHVVCQGDFFLLVAWHPVICHLVRDGRQRHSND